MQIAKSQTVQIQYFFKAVSHLLTFGLDNSLAVGCPGSVGREAAPLASHCGPPSYDHQNALDTDTSPGREGTVME